MPPAAPFLRRAAAVLGSPKFLWPLAAVILLVEGYYGIFYRTNDFDVHLKFGVHFLRGEPYVADMGQSFYPLPRNAFDAVLHELGRLPARVLCFSAAVFALGYTLRTFARLSRPYLPIPERLELPAVALALGAIFPFVIRDFDECGLQILLLGMMAAAAAAFAAGQRRLSGFWLGTAIVFKATPLLFLPLLVWKREWRALGWTLAFTALWSVSPALYLGWDGMVAQQKEYVALTRMILGEQSVYPATPNIEPAKIQNVSLRAAIARYVVSFPKGDPLHIDHPLFAQFGDLPHKTGHRVVMGLVLALGLAIAWRMRRAWGADAARDPNFAAEWATACLFAALMSPVCWRQHLVTALPCVYLALRSNLAAGYNWRWWVMGTASCVFLFTRREILGEDLARVVLSYKLDTFAILAVCALSLTMKPRAAGGVIEIQDVQVLTPPVPVIKAA